MLKPCVGLALIAISFSQCTSSAALKETSTQGQVSRCGSEGFRVAEAEHIIDEIKDPFIVCEIKGQAINATGYGWTKEVKVLFEIRPKGGGQIIRTHADENGRFVMKDIPDGQYCFKATVSGWQSVMGTIIVNKHADRKNRIVFKMVWAV